MKERIIRFLFSLVAGFGLAVLLAFLTGMIASQFVKESEGIWAVIALVEGTLAFGAITYQFYNYLKK